MFVAKQFDIIMGVDTHIVQPPGPVPPVPIPHPFIGIVFDPPEFVPIIGASILVNGIPRGQAGTKVKNTVPHIPIGGVFVKPPMNEGEIQMGSLTILADWQPCSFSGLPAYTCQDVGKTAPKRKKRKGGATKGLVMPTSIVLAIPKGGISGVGGLGGIPTESNEEEEDKKTPDSDLVGHRKDHILNRHRSGAGKPGKTEFPSSWDDKKIIDEVNTIANNPKAPGGTGKWNSPFKTGNVDGVEIRVDFYPPTHPTYAGRVSTAYPTNTIPNPL